MKTTALLIVVASSLSICAFSQAPRPLQVGIGTGWALPQGSHAQPGPLFYLEPTYRVSNTFSVGFRTEYMMTQRGIDEPYFDPLHFSTSRHGGGSATLNCQYYFTNSRVRPFIGAGAGAFFFTPFTQISNTVGEQFLSVNQHEVSGGTKFGGYERVGVTAGHFTFTAQYNLVFGKSADTSTTLTNANGVLSMDTYTHTVNNNYLSFMVGFVW